MVSNFTLSGGIPKIVGNTTTSSNASSIPTQGVTGNLEYVKMLTKDKLTVRVVCPNGKLVKSGIGSDFQINLGNEWSELAPIKNIPFVGDIGQSIIGLIMAGTGATQGSLEALWMTSASWSGSALPKFSVSLNYLNYSKSAPFMSDMLALAQGALTGGAYLGYDKSGNLITASNKAGDLSGIVNIIGETSTKIQTGIGEAISQFGGANQDTNSTNYKLKQDFAQLFKNNKQYGTTAPCNYGLQQDSSSVFVPKPNTTYTLRVGNWFEAPRLLVDSVTPSFSKEVVRSGNPLLMTINLVLRPYRKITFEEFSGYFKIKG